MDKKRKELLAASNVLQRVLQNSKSPLSDQFLRWKIWRFWPRIVGESLGALSEPVSYDKERRMLILWVKSSARMQDIRFFESVIREKVNEYVGRKWVYAVRFTLDRRGIPMADQIPQQVKDFLSDETPVNALSNDGDVDFSETPRQAPARDPEREPEA